MGAVAVALHVGALGDLELEHGRVEPGPVQRTADLRRQVRVAELDRREVDGHPDRVTGVAPAPALVAGGVQHPVADLADQPAGLGDGDELVGRQVAELRMLPAQQCLDGDQPPVAQGVARLIGEPELAALHGVTQLALQPSPHLLRRMQGLGIERHPVLAGALGQIERGIRGAEQRVRVLVHAPGRSRRRCSA